MRRTLVLLVAGLVLIAPESATIAVDPPDPGDVKPEIVWKKIPSRAWRTRDDIEYALLPACRSACSTSIDVWRKPSHERMSR